ncbi:MAG: ATP-binding protein [Mariprofundaceae bacterium]
MPSKAGCVPLDTAIALAIPLPVIALNAAGCIASANIEAQSELNLSEHALSGQHISHLFGPESEIEAIMQHLQQTRQPISDHGLCLRASGDPCALHIGVMQEEGYVVVMVPEANRQEHELHAKRQEMAEAVARIALEMAHEVKNPLAALGGGAQWLAEQITIEDQQEAVGMMREEVERIRQRIDDFLQLGPRAAIGMRKINIHKMLDEVSLPVEGVRVHRIYDPSLPNIQAHAGRLRQAIENLWRNALEAGATQIEWQTRINPTVQLPDSRGAVLEIRIINDGASIPDELQQHIFAPYVTGKNRGSGLGLALVQRIMQEHKGQVSLQADVGRTTVTMHLPLGQA